jgi:hypothetical protein
MGELQAGEPPWVNIAQARRYSVAEVDFAKFSCLCHLPDAHCTSMRGAVSVLRSWSWQGWAVPFPLWW